MNFKNPKDVGKVAWQISGPSSDLEQCKKLFLKALFVGLSLPLLHKAMAHSVRSVSCMNQGQKGQNKQD